MFKKSSLAILLTIVFYGVCISQNKISEINQIIDLGNAENIKTLIQVSGGSLFIGDRTEKLANISFKYDKYKWDPTVSYTEQDKNGKLKVYAKIGGNEKRIDENNECHIGLNKKKKYDLGLVLGAGKASINLSHFKLNKALFKLGVGSFNINLSNTSIPILSVEAGIGEATLDLSGKRKNNLSATINAGIGEITLIVPKDMGVKVYVSGFLGSVETPKYNKTGKEYTNDLWEESKHHIELKIKGAIGTVNIQEK